MWPVTEPRGPSGLQLPEQVATNPRKPETLVSVAAILPEDVATIESFIKTTLGVLKAHYTYYELLLIDNGLPFEIHGCVQRLQGQIPNIRLLRLTRPYGIEVALAAALDHCIGDYVVIMDCLAYPPSLIPQLVERAADGCDSVSALPIVHPAKFLDRVVIAGVYRAASRILGFPLQPNESYYNVYSRRLVNSIIKIQSKNRYLSYLNASVGLRHGVITYEPDPRKSPQPRLRRFVRLLLAALNILVSNSAAPLRLASALGLLASAANLLYLGYILAVTLVKSRIAEGWLTTSLTQTSMFLVLFLIMTILSEYIARILDETKEQPLYFVEFESNSTVSEVDNDRLNVIHEAGESSKSQANGARA